MTSHADSEEVSNVDRTTIMIFVAAAMSAVGIGKLVTAAPLQVIELGCLSCQRWLKQ